MLEKNQVENILRVNDVSITASDDEIRALLLSSKWTEDDIDLALKLLHNDVAPMNYHTDTLHKIFNSDQRLNQEEITNLLGIKTTLTNFEATEDITKNFSSPLNTALIILLTLVFVLAGVGYLMYQKQAGFFYSSSSVLTNE